MTLAFREHVYETCPRCRQIVGVEGSTALKARIKLHTRREDRIDLAQAMGGPQTPFPAYAPLSTVEHVPCDGAGMRSVEWSQRAKEAKLTRQLEREAEVKLDAMVAIDALAEGRPVFKFDALLRIAIKMHERLFGAGQRGKTVVRCETLRHRDRRDRRSFYRMDVYCRFCGGLVVPALNTASNPEAMPRVKAHSMRCALECLAGLREMQPSTVKGLIDEDRPIPD